MVNCNPETGLHRLRHLRPAVTSRPLTLEDVPGGRARPETENRPNGCRRSSCSSAGRPRSAWAQALKGRGRAGWSAPRRRASTWPRSAGAFGEGCWSGPACPRPKHGHGHLRTRRRWAGRRRESAIRCWSGRSYVLGGPAAWKIVYDESTLQGLHGAGPPRPSPGTPGAGRPGSWTRPSRDRRGRPVRRATELYLGGVMEQHPRRPASTSRRNSACALCRRVTLRARGHRPPSAAPTEALGPAEESAYAAWMNVQYGPCRPGVLLRAGGQPGAPQPYRAVRVPRRTARPARQGPPPRVMMGAPNRVRCGPDGPAARQRATGGDLPARRADRGSRNGGAAVRPVSVRRPGQGGGTRWLGPEECCSETGRGDGIDEGVRHRSTPSPQAPPRTVRLPDEGPGVRFRRQPRDKTRDDLPRSNALAGP